MIRVGIVGTTGLAGEGLVRVLLGHPGAQLACLCSDHAAGKDVAQEIPGLAKELSITLCPAEHDRLARETDVVFFAKKTPDSMRQIPKLLDAGVKAIDIGGEFRLKNPADYKQWYKNEHEAPGLLAEAVYGLPELHAERIRSARLVANPGCYPTSAVLPLAPLLREGAIEPDGIAIDSYSGISGAGKTSGFSFLDCNETVRAYSPTGHKHIPEIEQELSAVAGRKIVVTFVPHLVPLERGIHTTAFATAAGNAGNALQILKDFYANAPFVRVFDEPAQVTLLNVRCTNYCDISVALDKRSGKLIIVSALDNTTKGAGAQAVQNMNLMFGLNEITGLKHRSY
ncbi:MAG TPA: N-acetyl-gamma-glutamyl-phosphate reductase [Planctomycetota bacterium]|nr:N-acetyl-gamma-glutamyl-phosphate reductase [Planctomycetota bacterium]